MTECAVRPVRISRPPMTSGISIFSAAIAFSRFLSSARSGDPGAYERLGSLIGSGMRRTPANAAFSVTRELVVGSDAVAGLGGGTVVAVVDIVSLDMQRCKVSIVGRSGQRRASMMLMGRSEPGFPDLAVPQPAAVDLPDREWDVVIVGG